MKPFAKCDLFRGEGSFAGDRSPRWRGVPTAQKLLVNGFVARPAVRGGDLGIDDETVMVLCFLSLSNLMAFHAIEVLASMDT